MADPIGPFVDLVDEETMNNQAPNMLTAEQQMLHGAPEFPYLWSESTRNVRNRANVVRDANK